MKKVEKTEKAEESEKSKKSKKKIGIIAGVILGVLAVAGGGWIGVRTFLKREIVQTEELSLIKEGTEFYGTFRSYIRGRLVAAELFGREFRNLTDEEILEKLTEVKDVFSGVSRDVTTGYKGTEFEEMTEIMKNDATVYLKEVREVRQALTKTGEREDKQVELMKVVEENEGALRSAVFKAECAFPDGASGLERKGVLIFRGEMMVEVGGGVMNVFVGDAEKETVAVSTDDYEETVKTIRSEKAFGFYGGGVVRIGEGVKSELVLGKLKYIFVTGELDEGGKLEKRLVSLLGETTWSLDPKLEARGMAGLTKREK